MNYILNKMKHQLIQAEQIKLLQKNYSGKFTYSKSTKFIRENSLIQNPPNYPDLAYPNEYIWAYIKPRIKRRNPQTLEELKKFILEEWNEIPKKIIDNCGKKLQKKIRKSNRIRR